MGDPNKQWLIRTVCTEYSAMEAELDSPNPHKPRLLSAETVEVFSKSDDNELEKAVGDTFQWNRVGTKNGYIFMVFRVYFDIGVLAHNKNQANKEMIEQQYEESEGKHSSLSNYSSTVMSSSVTNANTTCKLM